jgi:hypothetical protein
MIFIACKGTEVKAAAAAAAAAADSGQQTLDNKQQIADRRYYRQVEFVGHRVGVLVMVDK